MQSYYYLPECAGDAYFVAHVCDGKGQTGFHAYATFDELLLYARRMAAVVRECGKEQLADDEVLLTLLPIAEALRIRKLMAPNSAEAVGAAGCS